MAKTREDKLRIARRLVEFACGRFGLPQSDLLIDPLTFTICTGNEDDRKLALWTLEAIERHPRASSRSCRSSWASPTSPSASTRPRGTCSTRCSSTTRMRRGLTGAIVHCQQDRAAAQDPARGGRGRRGPDLRPPRARATTRCRRSWRCSPTARPTPAVAKERPETRRGAAEAADRRRRQAGPGGRSRRGAAALRAARRSSTTSCSTA